MNKRGLTFVLCCLLMAVNAAAQNQRVGDVIDEFIDYYAEDIAPNIYHSPKQTSYSKYFRFDLPDKKKNVEHLNRLTHFFRLSMKDAYQYREHKAKMPTGDLQRVVYGDDNEFAIDFFKYSNRNYIVMLVKDSADVSKRYCYAFVWYKAGSRLMGSVHVIYGKNPQYVADTPVSNTGIKISENGRVTLGSDAIPGLKISENGRVLDVRVTEDDVFSNFFPTLQEVTEEARKNGKLMINIATADSVITDLEFLKRFSNLRGTLLEQRSNPTVAGSIANKLLELCKNYAYLQEEDTREVCIEELGRLMGGEFVRDPFVTNLLGLAIIYLEEAEKPKGK